MQPTVSTWKRGSSPSGRGNAFPSKPRVLLSAEHPIVLEGLHRIVEDEGFLVVGTVRESYALVEAVEALVPHLIVLEFAMTGLNGVDAARRIRKRNPRIPLLFLGVVADEPAIGNVMRDGASGYVSKGAAIAELRSAMRTMLEGRIYSSLPSIVQTRSRLPRPPESDPSIRPLTKRQCEVLQLVSEGKTAKEVASALNISSKTAEFHKANIMEVLHLRTTAELTRYAIQYETTRYDGPDRRATNHTGSHATR